MKISHENLTIQMNAADRDMMQRYFRNTAGLIFDQLRNEGPPVSDEDAESQQSKRRFMAYGMLMHRKLSHGGATFLPGNFEQQPELIERGCKLASAAFAPKADGDADTPEEDYDETTGTRWTVKRVTNVRKEGDSYVVDVETVGADQERVAAADREMYAAGRRVFTAGRAAFNQTLCEVCKVSSTHAGVACTQCRVCGKQLCSLHLYQATRRNEDGKSEALYFCERDYYGHKPAAANMRMKGFATQVPETVEDCVLKAATNALAAVPTIMQNSDQAKEYIGFNWRLRVENALGRVELYEITTQRQVWIEAAALCMLAVRDLESKPQHRSEETAGRKAQSVTQPQNVTQRYSDGSQTDVPRGDGTRTSIRVSAPRIMKPCEVCGAKPGAGSAVTVQAQCVECMRFGCASCMTGEACKECIAEKQAHADKQAAMPKTQHAIEFWGRVLGERRTYDLEWGADAYHYAKWKGYADAELDRLQRVTHEGRLEIWTRVAAVAQAAFESELRTTAALIQEGKNILKDGPDVLKGAVPVCRYPEDFWQSVRTFGTDAFERESEKSTGSYFLDLAARTLTNARRPRERKMNLVQAGGYIFAAYLRLRHIEAAHAAECKKSK